MGLAAWEGIKNFNPEEFVAADSFPDLSVRERGVLAVKMMDETTIRLAQAVRTYTKKEFIVNEGYALGGHATNSLHYGGKALDGRIKGLSLVDQFFVLIKFEWGGIGLYPIWDRPGFHVDTRPVAPNSPRAFWVCLERRTKKHPKGRYLALNEKSFVKTLEVLTDALR